MANYHSKGSTRHLNFVVPAYNRRAIAGSHLSAIHAAAVLPVPYEIIVGDDGSQIGTGGARAR